MLPGFYDGRLVALSVLISIFAAYAALDLGGRVTSTRGAARLLWLGGGATAMGIGIWSMHYIGMLAFHLPVPVMYDWPTVLLSLLASIVASGIALYVVSGPRLGLPRAIAGSIFMGAGIAAMHYIGMAAMRLPAMCHYSPALVTLSVVLAMAISFVALWLTFHLRGDIRAWGWQKIVSSVVMGAAIPVMHYTGMAAASFAPAALMESDLGYAVSVSSLGITSIVAATLTVLGLVLLSSMADRQFSIHISRQKEVESALSDSERTYGLTFDAAPIGIAHVALNGRWLRVNQRLCDLLGYTAGQLIATDVLAIMHPDEVDPSTQAWKQLRTGTIDRQASQKRYRRGDGQYIWANVTTNVNRDAAGEPTHFVTIVEDITERRKVEEQLRQAQKMEAVGQLAAGVAHDFNNLLTVIIGYSELTLKRIPPRRQAHRNLEQVLHSAQSAAALTNQLLAFSRQQMLQPQILDVNGVIGRMELLLGRAIGENVQLVYHLDPSVGRVSADPGQLEQVVINLVVNARDAMPRGGVITIATDNVQLDEAYVETHHGASPGAHVRIAITDTGMGIPDSDRPHLFEPFFTTKERGKGTGLGLATVYGIVKQSDGSIWVDSEVGHGTTFNIHLPRTEHVADALPGTAQTRAAPGGTETILIAEDQAEVGAVMRATLEGEGYAVLEARGGEEALRLSAAHADPIHLLLTDVVMPGMTGRDLAHALRELRPSVRVLYTSGYTDHAIVRQGVIESGLAFIQKPFSPESLLRKVRDTLDTPDPS